ncbi:MAG TPA: uroporphyrinogen-III C-methyltransferase [Noviherbaspirillum sp.]|jgi:uroporphyrin-3 C-methyltransferase/uroporphyrinogen III methyltransferase/synthase|uniref:uroporphyrinogen-III C-methyltransferase n=1 Tax=Noviherbaspirillum sp. TaxID=1926288 RepID=UPI002DDCDC7B|nr:uroporphyrinogen-III C-methyltransferase [Noviherbaspirillum sp.]HEV2610633.1 uroporphyrinogen-III C-methyltransferase [Noviherbaspirillum sp.]
MNDLPSSSSPGTSHSNASLQHGGPDPVPGTSTRGLRRLIYIAFGILAVLMVAQWWASHNQIAGLREELAQRLKTGESLNTETKVLVKSMQDGLRELEAKVSVQENKQVEAQSQQLALEQLYQDLAKNRDDWALAEIEQVLSTASQQLQLAGNVQGALIALQNADSRLSGSDQPQFITIRRAIAKDLDRLRSLPNVDMAGVALRLDSAIGLVDSMPLLSDEKPLLPASKPRNARAAADTSPGKPDAGTGTASEWLATLEEKWHSWTSEMWGEIRQLIRVRDVEAPEALLLSPTQAYYARENLKLRLLNARLALLSRNETAFRSDLIAAQDAISKYFDTRAKQTQNAQALLRQVQGTNLVIEMPTLAESLNAVRNYKANP